MSAKTKSLWRELLEQYDFSPNDLETLRVGLEALDDYDRARAVLRKEGFVFTKENGEPRSRPENKIANDARTAFVRCFRELGLELNQTEEYSRPTFRLRGIEGGKR